MDHPQNNTFLAVSQFKVDCAGGMSKGSVRPDITLFINGIPVVVVECTSPTISEPIASAIDQLRRYHNARKESGEVEKAEGSERLFYTNQFLIGTSYDEARVGMIGAQAVHYLEWKDIDGAIAALRQERVPAEFSVKLKQFLATLDLVLPRPEALPFVHAAVLFGEIHDRARRLYREGLAPLGKEIGRKVQELIDGHIISLGIDPRTPPISITDARFAEQVSRQVSPRGRATELEFALRQHIKKKHDEDPVHYQRLSERLEQILDKFGDNWEQLALIPKAFVEEAAKGRTVDETFAGLDPERHAPFFDVLVQERAKLGAVTLKDRHWLAELTIEMVERLIRDAIGNAGFWKSGPRQEELHGHLFMFLDENDIVEFDDAEAVAGRLLELAKANHGKLAKPT